MEQPGCLWEPCKPPGAGRFLSRHQGASEPCLVPWHKPAYKGQPLTSAFRPWFCFENSKFPRKTTPLMKYRDTQYKTPKAVTVCLLSGLGRTWDHQRYRGKRWSVPKQDTCNARGAFTLSGGGWIYFHNFNPSLASRNWEFWEKGGGCILGRTKGSNFNTALGRTVGRIVFCKNDIPLTTTCKYLLSSNTKPLLK